MGLMPASDPARASLERKFAELERELRALQKQVTPESRILVTSEVVFSRPAAPVANEMSGDYVIRMTDGAIQRIDFTARTAGSTDSVVVVYVNDSAAHTMIVPSGERLWVEDGLFIEVGEYDTVQVALTVVGSGLSSVVVTITLSEIGEE